MPYYYSVQESAGTDRPDAMAVPVEPVEFTLEDSGSKEEEMHVIPLHKKPGRPNIKQFYLENTRNS